MLTIRHKSGLIERVPASKNELARILSRNLIPAVAELAVAIRKLEKQAGEGEAGAKAVSSILPAEFIIERKMKLIERFGRGAAVPAKTHAVVPVDEPKPKKARRKKQ